MRGICIRVNLSLITVVALRVSVKSNEYFTLDESLESHIHFSVTATRRLKERAHVNVVITMLSVDSMEEGNILPLYLALSGLRVVLTAWKRVTFYHHT